MIALVAYEYILTLHLEVSAVWQRPLTSTSLLLLSTRYIIVAAQALNVLPASRTVSIQPFFCNLLTNLGWI